MTGAVEALSATSATTAAGSTALPATVDMSAPAVAAQTGGASAGVSSAFSSPWMTGLAALMKGATQISEAQTRADSSRQGAADATFRAQQSEVAARQEQLRGEQQAQQVRETLRRTLASQNARFAGAGITLDDGTPETIAADTDAVAGREIGTITSNARMRGLERKGEAGRLSAEAGRLRINAENTEASGFAGASASLFDYVDRSSARRPGTVRR